MARGDSPRLVTAPRLIAGVLVLGVFYFASAVFLPFVTATLIALLLDPVVTRMEFRGISRTVATTLTLTLFALCLVIAGWVAYGVSVRTMRQAPQYVQKVKSVFTSIERKTGEFTGQFRVVPVTPLDSPSLTEPNRASKGEVDKGVVKEKEIQRVEVVDGISYWRSVLFRTVGSVFEIVSLAFFVPLFVFYFLIDKSNLVESFNTLVGRSIYVPKLNRELPRMVRAFVRGNLVGGVILVVLHLALFLGLGLKNALPLAFVSGFLNLIPLLGGPLALFLPVAQGLLQWSDPILFLAMGVGIFVFHFLVGNVVLPHMLGSRINVNPACLIFGLLFWGWLWGAIGFLVAIPLTATLRILLENHPAGIPLANLMAAKPRHVLFTRRRDKTAS